MLKAKNKNIILVVLSLLLSISVIKNICTHTNYVSHSDEPKVGDNIQNNNPSCKHYESIGKVVSIQSLKNNSGKTITYKVENDGTTYCKGQLLTKTMDQLVSI